MIANVTPAAQNYEETLSTLNYANRAKNIRVLLKKNVLEREDYYNPEIEKMLGDKALQQKLVSGLKSEIVELRKLLGERDAVKKSILFCLI